MQRDCADQRLLALPSLRGTVRLWTRHLPDNRVAKNGATALVVAEGNRVLGVIALSDVIKAGIKERIAKARDISVSRVNELIARYTEGPTLGIFGQRRVNVLKINLALDGKESFD